MKPEEEGVQEKELQLKRKAKGVLGKGGRKSPKLKVSQVTSDWLEYKTQETSLVVQWARIHLPMQGTWFDPQSGN